MTLPYHVTCLLIMEFFFTIGALILIDILANYRFFYRQQTVRSTCNEYINKEGINVKCPVLQNYAIRLLRQTFNLKHLKPKYPWF